MTQKLLDASLQREYGGPAPATPSEQGFLDLPTDQADAAAPPNGPLARVPREISSTLLADVMSEGVMWLWADYLPVGKLVVLQGDPGVGKSTFTLYCAARVSTGTPFHGATDAAEPGDVLVLSYEDNAADTIKPRAEAAAADMSRIHVLHGVGQGRDPVTLPDHIAELRAKIIETGARLLIIDPLGACLGRTVDSYVDASVRRLLAPLAQLAEETGCTVLIVRHLVKAVGGRALHAGGGSVGITGAARLVLQIGAAPDNPDERVLAVVKCNVAPHAPSLRYRIATVALEEGVSAPRIDWIGTTDVTADDLIDARNEQGRDRSVREEARAWLEHELADGARLVREVMGNGKAAGFAARTLQRAAHDLKVARRRETLTSPWIMVAPDDL